MEQWKDITWYEWLYKITYSWKIMSLTRDIIIRPWINDWYLFVTLTKNRQKKTFRVHRLVAQEFIPNPDWKPIVLHNDNNRANPHWDNLRWWTHYENIRQMIDDWRQFTKEIIQYSLSWEFIREWKSLRHASDSLWIWYTTLSFCLTWRYMRAWKFKWKYK